MNSKQIAYEYMYNKFLKLRENIDSYMKMNYPNKMITLDLQ